MLYEQKSEAMVFMYKYLCLTSATFQTAHHEWLSHLNKMYFQQQPNIPDSILQPTFSNVHSGQKI